MYSIYYNFAPETFISIISDIESKNSKRTAKEKLL